MVQIFIKSERKERKCEQGTWSDNIRRNADCRESVDQKCAITVQWREGKESA